ncbi:MAG: ribosome-associated translation inhibitor RaiA [Bacteroidota bacterium]|nr:ribosome-associated translation inhibitor RaiA [Bacteroidota bacterium]
MDINITSIHFNADSKLETFIKEKVSKLKQFNEELLGADITLSLDRPAGKNFNSKTVKLKIQSKGYDFFAEKKSESFEAATDSTIEAIRSQILKRKEKIMKKN